MLDTHNPLEQIDGGVYDQSEDLAGSEADEALAQIATTPLTKHPIGLTVRRSWQPLNR